MNNVLILVVKPDPKLIIKKVTAIKEDYYLLADCNENGQQIGTSKKFMMSDVTLIGDFDGFA